MIIVSYEIICHKENSQFCNPDLYVAFVALMLSAYMLNKIFPSCCVVERKVSSLRHGKGVEGLPTGPSPVAAASDRGVRFDVSAAR